MLDVVLKSYFESFQLLYVCTLPLGHNCPILTSKLCKLMLLVNFIVMASNRL